MSESEIKISDQLERELHRIDAEIDKVRRRIVWLERTLIAPDESPELAQLKQRYEELSERFVETYKRWNSQA